MGSNIATLFLPLGPYEPLIHKGLNKQSGTKSEMKNRCLLFRDQEAVGSNPATPTIKAEEVFASSAFIISSSELSSPALVSPEPT